MEESLKIWNSVLEICKNSIPDISFKTWFVKIIPVKIIPDKKTVILAVSSEFHKQTLINCYMDILINAFSECFSQKFDIKFNIVKAETTKKTQLRFGLHYMTQIKKNQNRSIYAAEVNSSDIPMISQKENNINMEKSQINRIENKPSLNIYSQEEKNNIPSLKLIKNNKDTNIQFTNSNLLNFRKFKYANRENVKKNEKDSDTSSFTFNNYIIGACNNLAHSAALAVSNEPGEAFNPLFIYGSSGLGKTHLLYAIKHKIEENFKDKDVVYIRGDNFTNELIESIKTNNTLNFHQKYRYADVLLVDDIQFIGGKESTQEEFFHTFNSLYELKKQIVITSDRPPKEIKTLEERLRSRFEGGLIADVTEPNLETRMAIIYSKTRYLKIMLTSGVCEYIASKIKSNVRQIEGVLKKLRAHNLLANEPINLSLAREVISDILNNETNPQVTITRVLDEISKILNVRLTDIRSSKRHEDISIARKISMYIIKNLTQISLKDIGQEFGGRNHSTVVYSIRQIEEKINQDPHIKGVIDDIINNIRSIGI